MHSASTATTLRIMSQGHHLQAGPKVISLDSTCVNISPGWQIFQYHLIQSVHAQKSLFTPKKWKRITKQLSRVDYRYSKLQVVNQHEPTRLRPLLQVSTEVLQNQMFKHRLTQLTLQ